MEVAYQKYFKFFLKIWLKNTFPLCSYNIISLTRLLDSSYRGIVLWGNIFINVCFSFFRPPYYFSVRIFLPRSQHFLNFAIKFSSNIYRSNAKKRSLFVLLFFQSKLDYFRARFDFFTKFYNKKQTQIYFLCMNIKKPLLM